VFGKEGLEGARYSGFNSRSMLRAFGDIRQNRKRHRQEVGTPDQRLFRENYLPTEHRRQMQTPEAD
jgi:hypothetical protein